MILADISNISTTGIKETGYTFGGGNLSKYFCILLKRGLH